MKVDNFFSELRQRNVYKVAAAYAVIGWLLVQVATQVLPFFEIPNSAVRLIVSLIVIGFPIALVIARAFELTPKGISRTEDVSPNESRNRNTGRKLMTAIVVVAIATLALLLFQLAGNEMDLAPQF
jgi:hypothetical protein